MRLYKPPPCRAERQIKKLQFADINTFVDLLYLLFLSRQTEILQIQMAILCSMREIMCSEFLKHHSKRLVHTKK